jgi:hypothetical protein
MTPKGADLEATDLIEVSTIESGSYVTRSITGQELIDAIPLPPTGLTVGTTPISSGTIGRVLFQGTGNVLQESANLTYSSASNLATIAGINLTTNVSGSFISVNEEISIQSTSLTRRIDLLQSSNVRLRVAGTTGNVLINTTTDAGFRLDVNGTARVSGTARIESSLTALSSATIGGTTLAANAIFQVNGSGKYVNYNSSFSSGSFLTYQAYGTWDAIGADSPAGTILAFGGYRASQWTGMTFHSNGSERMRIFSTGNVLINTTTDAGFRLDVNGTARVSSNLTVSSAGTSTMNTFLGGSVAIGNDWVNDGYILKIKSVNTGIAGIYSRAGGAGGYPIFWCQDANGTASTTFIVRENGSVHVGATANVPSSKLTLTSTTQGFLPPRMTTTEKNAIASPATGLQVYDTTLNRPCFYDGTTWITL